jgi:hypothetical protein
MQLPWKLLARSKLTSPYQQKGSPHWLPFCFARYIVAALHEEELKKQAAIW